jgi:hypothetical protein
MEGFKRNQVEDAISRWFKAPCSEVRTRIKRLLDTDRKLPLPERSALKRHFIAKLRTGNEVVFSEFEAFAVLVAMPSQTRMAAADCGRAHERRSARTRAFHRRILHQDRKEIFDREKVAEEAKWIPFATDNACPTFLLIVSDSGEPERNNRSDQLQVHVFRATEAFAFSRKRSVAQARFSNWLLPPLICTTRYLPLRPPSAAALN